MMLAALRFVARYAMVRWEDTREGRNLMLMGVALFLLGGVHIARIWFEGHPGPAWEAYDVAMGCLFLVIAYDLVQRDCLRQRLMMRRRRGEETR